jgi:SAM-dependent methyltransferase
MTGMNVTPGWSPSLAGLDEEPTGFWAAPHTSPVFYPADGHQLFHEVEERSFWFTHRNQCISSTIQRLPPEGVLLDVGGGNGFVARELMRHGVNVMLIEPGRDGARNAWLRGVRPVVNATLADAGFAVHSVGGVGLFDVIEHIEDDVQFLRESREYLVDGGRVYATVPAFSALWSHEDRLAGHFRRYSAGSLRRAFERAGFDVEYLTAMFVWLPIPVLLARRLPYLLGRSAANADRTRAEHALPDSLAGRLLTRALMMEHRTISRGGRFVVGGSLLVVAKRRP